MSVIVLKCGCGGDRPGVGSASVYQDRVYGKGRRVHNLNGKGDAECTCCSTIQRGIVRDADKKKSTNGGGRGGARSFIARPPLGGWTGGHPEKNGYRKI